MSTNIGRGQGGGQGDNVPVPDPSLLTTEQLHREIFGLRELLEVKLGASSEAVDLIREIVEARLNGMDKAIVLLQHAADETYRRRTDEKIAALREQNDEKFASIQTQFRERDVRTDQAAGAVKIAVDAALQAQKEAASEANKSNTAATQKSEASTTKLIDAQATLIASMGKAFDDKFADVKDRITRIEGGHQGVDAARSRTGQVLGYAVGIGGLLIGAAAVIVTIILKFAG